MDKTELLPLVDKWQQRQELADDVDYILSQGGTEWLLKGLNTDVETGIEEESILRRRDHFGTNVPDLVIPKTIFELFCENLKDLTLIVLIIAGIASSAIGMATEPEHRTTAWIEGFAILMAVIQSAGVLVSFIELSRTTKCQN